MAILQGDAGTTKKKSPVTAALGTPQGTAFGGTNGPYIGTLTPAPPVPSGDWVPPPTSGGNPDVPGDTSSGSPGPDPYLSNPGYLAALAAEQTGSQQADAALRAAQEAAIIQYGDPALAQALGIGVSPQTAAAARANYLAGNATLARLDKQHALNQQGSINNLAAHGILFSGETGYQRGQIDQGYGNQVYDAQQALLNQNQTWQQQNLATKTGLHNDVTNALTGAYNTFVSNPAFYALAPAAAPGTNNASAGSTPTPPTASPTAAALAQIPLKTSGSRLAGKATNPYSLARRFA